MCRILFIGNSHTYLHYMPQLLAGLAEKQSKTIYTEQITGEGAGLEWHWQRCETRERIERGRWTHVVLQDRSRGPLEDKDGMHRHARRLHERIQRAGARTVFYMTWAARDRPEEQAVIAGAYRDIALACRAMLAPVGLAWDLVRKQPENPDLFHRDGRHAGKAGAYLSACVFYALICGEDPAGLSPVLKTQGRLRVDLPGDVARSLQAAARAAVTVHGIH